MIQVNRVTRIGRQATDRTGKIACVTVAKMIQFDRVGTELMPARIVVADLEADRLFRRAGVPDRAAEEASVAGKLQARMKHFDRLRL